MRMLYVYGLVIVSGAQRSDLGSWFIVISSPLPREWYGRASYSWRGYHPVRLVRETSCNGERPRASHILRASP